MRPQVRVCHQQLDNDAREIRKDPPLEPSEKAWLSLHLDLGSLTGRKHERISTVPGNSLLQPQETNTAAYSTSVYRAALAGQRKKQFMALHRGHWPRSSPLLSATRPSDSLPDTGLLLQLKQGAPAWFPLGLHSTASS